MIKQLINYTRRHSMSKTKKGQFDHYKRWTTDEGYTFVAETREDALEYLKLMDHDNLGLFREVKDSE